MRQYQIFISKYKVMTPFFQNTTLGSQNQAKPTQPTQVLSQHTCGKGHQNTQKKDLQTPTVKTNYRWTREQHKKYVRFLAQNMHLFKMNYLDKMKMKIHVKMSLIISNRTSYQCRSHHQKMLIKYGSIENVVQNFAYLLPSANLVKPKSVHLNSQLTIKVQDKQLDQCKLEDNNEVEYVFFPKNEIQKEADLILQEEEQVIYKTFE